MILSLANITLYGPPILIAIMTGFGLLRTTYLAKRAGVTVLAVKDRKKTPTEMVLGVSGLLLNIYCFSRLILPDPNWGIWIMPPALVWAGVVLQVIGTVWLVTSQAQMGKSWRIGVPEDREDSQTVVTEGLYRFSRNPIYVGVIVFVAGLTLSLPSLITVISLVINVVFIRNLVAREEAYMAKNFGEDYALYCSKVRRWL